MTAHVEQHPALPAASGSAPGSAEVRGLRNYYALRAVASAAWVAAAVSVGKAVPLAGAALLVAYPAWDAAANLLDARRSGGLARNRTQAINAAVSGATALAILASFSNMNAAVGVFGLWAILAGLLQLATGVRRWKAYGAQWVMILSGAQSVLAGGFIITRALGAEPLGVASVAGYAGFGAAYFLVSALWLTFRRPQPRGA